MEKYIDRDSYCEMKCVEELKEEGINEKWEKNIRNKSQLSTGDFLGRKINEKRKEEKNNLG
ncbi:MAG: hypothetical protein II992_07445 [Lachnospiraceae bacterium]|nr:hypothetical protein [Lachnospiraceae bacterium]